MFLLKRAIILLDFGMPLTKDNSEFTLQRADKLNTTFPELSSEKKRRS